MPKLSEILFGSEGRLQTQTHSLFTPEQEAVMRNVLESLDMGVVGPSSNFLDPREQTSLEALERRALQREEMTSAGDEALMELIRGRGSPGDIDEFFTTNVQNPLLEQFEREIMPRIGRSFGGSSFFSSDRAQADRAAQEELLDTLVRSRSELAFKERGEAADRLLRALGLQSDRTTAETDVALRELGAFGLPRQARDARIAQILDALGVRGREVLGGMTSGSTGLVQAFVSGIAGGIGGGLGKKIAD